MNIDFSRHNRKDRFPSDSMLPSDGVARFCPWIEDSLTILSDGTVTCGLDDTDGLRNFGSILESSVQEIFANPEFTRLSEKLRQGHRCRDCQLYQPLTAPRPARDTLPCKLVVEPTVRCNLRCPQSACFANNSPDLRTRDRDDLPRDALASAVAEIGPSLKEVYFFNYGDPFMHRQAPAMIADIRRASPSVKIVTSTNGIPLSARRKAKEVVAAGIDHVVFTISGMTQESYERYHVNGRLDSALRGMRNVIEERADQGLSRPRVIWRYLGFRWTDSPDQLDAAIALAQDLGVDEFCVYLTHIPEDGWSYRLAEGTMNYARYREWINVAFGYNRPPPPDRGMFPHERLEGFGRARWTGWHARPNLLIEDGHAVFWVATNSPAAAAKGHAEVAIVTPWRRAYRTRAPYCGWGRVAVPVPGSFGQDGQVSLDLYCPDEWFPADWLGVTDYRGLGVLFSHHPDGTLPQGVAELVPMSPKATRQWLVRPDVGALSIVESGIFAAFRGQPSDP